MPTDWTTGSGPDVRRDPTFVEGAPAGRRGRWGRRLRRVTTLFVIAVVLVATTFVAENREILGLLLNAGRDGPMIYAVPAVCRAETTDIDMKEAREGLAVEASYRGVQSAASTTLTNSDTWRELRPADTIFDLNGRLADQIKARRAVVTLPNSGIRLHLYSEYALEVDVDDLDALWHSSLHLDDELDGYPALQNLVACYRRSIIEERRFAGADYHVFILSRNECWRAVRLQVRPDGVDRREFCDSSAVTPPKLGRISFLGQPIFPVWASLTNLMVLTPNAGDPGDLEAIEEHLNAFLLHESIHVPDRLMGNQWWADPEERKVQYLEEIIRKKRFPEGVPTAIQIIDGDV